MLSRRITWLWLGVCLLSGSLEAFAQYKDEKEASIPLDYFFIERHGGSMFRALLSKVNISISTGYGQTFFKHELEGYGILQMPDSVPKIFNSNQVSAGYTNWFNKASASTNNPPTGSFLVNSDTATIGFKSRGYNIPLKAMLHVEFDRYRIGGGYSVEYMHIGDFQPISYSSDISSFSPNASSIAMQKYFGMIGGTVYRYYEYALVVDANIGGYSLGKHFDKSIIKKGAFFNIGARLERDFSEYFRLFIRPSFELKSYKLNIPESGSITHKFNAVYVNVGMTYRLPDLRRCPFKKCRIQINHAHGNREYRSRVHPFYKKQNPHYGENYPTLIKYKGKNKKKLNPY